jgi:hypothetical protein
VERKICRKCKIEKFLDDFSKDKGSTDGHYLYCKECCKLSYQSKFNLIKEKKRFYSKKYNIENKEKIQSYRKEYRINNREKAKEYRIKNKEKQKSYNKEYSINNRERINKYKKNRNLNEPICNLINNVRSRLKKYLKSTGITKNKKTFDIIGCPPQQLKEHLEKQFVDGMSWDNYSFHSWHIDHIIPLSSAKTEEDLKKLCHYTNLQPLWAEDNLKKSNKIL